MSTYLDLRIHIIFATKHRQPLIHAEWRERLHGYLGGTLNGLGAAPLAIGGTEDHVHLLVALRGNHSVADLVRETKKASTTWTRQEMGVRSFTWQEGYAAFSVGSEKEAVVHYIRNQEAHHQTRSSSEELRTLLEDAGVEIDERFFD